MADNKETEIKVKVDSTGAVKSLNDLKKEWLANEKAANDAAIGSKEYAEAQQKAASSKSAYEGARKDAAELRKENVNLVESLGKFTPANGIIGDLGNKFSEVKGGVMQAGKSLMTFNGLLAASAIGAFLLILSSVVLYFQRTDTGAKKLEGAMKALDFIINKAVGVLVKFGDFLINDLPNAFNKATGPAKGFFDLIKKGAELLVDPFVKVFNLIPGVDKFKASLKELGDEIADAAKAGMEYAELMDQIDEKQRNINVANSEAEVQIAALRRQAKNRFLDEVEGVSVAEERKNKLIEAGKLEEQVLLRSTSLIQEKIKAQQLEIDQAIKANGADANIDDMLNKRADLQVQINQARLSSVNIQEKIKNDLAALEAEITADIQKETDERNKIEQKQAAIQQKNIDLRTSLIEAGYNKDLELLQQKYSKEFEQINTAEGESGTQLLLLREKYLQDKEALDAVYKQKEIDTAIANVVTDEEQQLLQRKLYNSLNQEEEAAYQNALYEIQKKALVAKLNLLTGDDEKTKAERVKTGNQLVNLEIENNKRITADKKKAVDDQNRLDQLKLNAASNIIGGLTDLAAELGGANVKATMGFKALASAEVVLNGIMEVQRIWAGAAALGPIAAPIVGGLQTGIAVVRAGVALSKINSVQPGKAAKYGAIIRGPKHGSNYGDGGIALIDRVSGQEVGEMEGEEPILTAGVTRNPRLLAAASRINVMGGGRPLFADGGIPSASFDSSTDPSNNSGSNEVTSLRNDIRELINVMATNEGKEVILYYNKLKEFENDLDVTLKYANK